MSKISIVLTTYNEKQAFLKKCLKSVLHQTFGKFEFFIVLEPEEKNLNFFRESEHKDGRIKVMVNKRRLGISGSRNRAIESASGEYIAFIDGDDYCDSTRFEQQFRFLENHPEIGVVGTNMYLIDIQGNVIGERKYPEKHSSIRKEFLFQDPLANPTLMVRKAVFDHCGMFDNLFPKSEDFEMLLRFLANGVKMANLQERLVYYRVLDIQNRNRGKKHWKYNYIARKRHSKKIWPLPARSLSLFFYNLLDRLPNSLTDSLMEIKMVDRIKAIKRN